MMKINILLPFFSQKPGGGLKIMYQYANSLAERGHSVTIYHAKKTSGLHKKSLSSWLLYFLQRFFKKTIVQRPQWFSLNTSIESIQIAWIDNHLIRNADIVFSTWWATAMEMNRLDSRKGEKFNLIQDDGTHHPNNLLQIRQSYRLPINYLAISKHIQDLVFQYSGKLVPIISNGLDGREFGIHKPIESRFSRAIMMLYSEEKGKGSEYGLEALKLVTKKYPDLQVTLFGVYAEPRESLPERFAYYFNPSNLSELYNRSAIFVSPSLQEGWGLPPMEAMACGCACVCTRILGHLEFMNDDTAVLVSPENSTELASGIIKLIEEPSLRYQLISRGVERVAGFSFEESASKLEQIFLSHFDEINR